MFFKKNKKDKVYETKQKIDKLSEEISERLDWTREFSVPKEALQVGKIEEISEAIRVSRRTNMILWQNIIFSLGVKIIVMLLVILGLTNMWAAVFADVGVTLIAVLNSMRIIR